MYPRIIIDLEKFRKNLRHLLDECHKRNITMMAVSKVFCADHKLINILNEERVDFIADSRIQNLKGIASSIPKVLLRLPRLGEVPDVVKYTSISFNSEMETIRSLDKEAKKINVKHGVILMIDLGDLREGIFEEKEVFETVEKVLKLDNIKLRGIGTNLTCYGGVIPTVDVLQKLVDYKKKIEEIHKIKLDIVSGGNSSTIEMLLENQIPAGINNLRLGESVVLGRETAYGNYIDFMYNDVFTLEADIIELKQKPCVPIGQIGMNAFGKIPVFKDKGKIFRAILAIGKQDVDHRELKALDTIELLGSSSDHIIVDVSESNNFYDIGDTMLFRLTYASILSLMSSKYVVKFYED